MRIAKFFSWFKKKKDQRYQVAVINTFKSKKERIAYLKFLKEMSIKAKQVGRGLHGGGCPAPFEITKPGWLDNL